ncbi:MAG TPA: HAD-IA family hydrolase [Labilithrix sp.]
MRYDDVDLLCLDAGNTVIFLDHARLAELLRGFGVDASVHALIRAEGEAKRLAESGGLADPSWTFRDRPGAAAWGRMVATIAARAGFPSDKLGALLDVVWPVHVEKNLWCRVPEGLGEALDAIRARGVRTAIISNSEAVLERLFTLLGIRGHFDLVVDSGVVGVEKPDPKIFRIALDRFGVAPSRALHLGDVFATDILGARAAGIRCALIDPFGHYAGMHADVERVAGAVEVARAIADARKAAGS